eukprot:2441334-Rhodomonas_salina.1
MPLVVQVIIVPSDKTEDLTALQELLESKVGSGELTSELDMRAIDVETFVVSVELGVSATVSEPIPDGGLPDDAQYVEA